MNPQNIELYVRHIHEGGAMIARFLTAHPSINPDLIEDLTGKQEAQLQRYMCDLTVTQQIERDALRKPTNWHP
jgi:hypothetical protein